jgi:hypothetical protein
MRASAAEVFERFVCVCVCVSFATTDGHESACRRSRLRVAAV